MDVIGVLESSFFFRTNMKAHPIRTVCVYFAEHQIVVTIKVDSFTDSLYCQFKIFILGDINHKSIFYDRMLLQN